MWFAVVVVVVMIAWFAFEAHRKARVEQEATAINAGKIKLKTIVADGPFRSNAAGVYEEPATRPAELATLEAVQAALRTAGLTLRPIQAKKPKPGFEIAGPKGFLRITVADRARVEPSTMMIAYTEAELVVDGAVALVPLFGPIGIDMGDAAWLVVDGSRDVAAIRKELSDRYLAMMKQMMESMAPLQEMLDQIGKAVERKRT